MEAEQVVEERVTDEDIEVLFFYYCNNEFNNLNNFIFITHMLICCFLAECATVCCFDASAQENK